MRIESNDTHHSFVQNHTLSDAADVLVVVGLKILVFKHLSDILIGRDDISFCGDSWPGPVIFWDRVVR